MRALLSVYDKTNVTELASNLCEAGFELISTGGTYESIKTAGYPVKQVADVTGSPEILGGRVKTLHPAIYGGILARRNKTEHLEELNSHKIDTIDVVVVNLYPFVETISKPDVTLDDALENIDIGGPTMIRAAAKNFPSVVVIVDPSDYGWVSEKILSGTVSTQDRKHLAFKAFHHVAVYDTAISRYLMDGDFPEETTFAYQKLYDLRYGENPHQKAAFYADSSSSGIASASQLHGKELSYNNILDADSAWRAVTDLKRNAVAIIKHTNTCGLASHDSQLDAYNRAFQGDPVSAFGGIVAFNRQVTLEVAQAMSKVFYEIVIAPDFQMEALELLKKKRDLRILAVADNINYGGYNNILETRQVSGGMLIQTQDVLEEDPTSWQVVTKRKPNNKELEDMAFAWKAVKHVKSNAIVLAKDEMLLGMGAGQPNRINSVHLAIKAAGNSSKDSILASDAFFPFADGVEAGAEGGIAGVVQPGGSIRDDEVIEAADRLGLFMVFTGVRHFRH